MNGPLPSKLIFLTVFKGLNIQFQFYLNLRTYLENLSKLNFRRKLNRLFKYLSCKLFSSNWCSKKLFLQQHNDQVEGFFFLRKLAPESCLKRFFKNGASPTRQWERLFYVIMSKILIMDHYDIELKKWLNMKH